VLEKKLREEALEKSSTNEVLINISTDKLLKEKYSGEEVLEKSSTGEVMEESSTDKLLEKRSTDELLEKGSRDEVLEKRSTGKVLEISSTDEVLEKSSKDEVLENISKDKGIEEISTGRVLENSSTKEDLENSSIDEVIEESSKDEMLEKGSIGKVIEKSSSDEVIKDNLKDEVIENSSKDEVLENSSTDEVIEENAKAEVIEEISADKVNQKSSTDNVLAKGPKDEVLVKGSAGEILEKSSKDEVLEKSSTDEVIEKRELSNQNKESLDSETLKKESYPTIEISLAHETILKPKLDGSESNDTVLSETKEENDLAKNESDNSDKSSLDNLKITENEGKADLKEEDINQLNIVSDDKLMEDHGVPKMEKVPAEISTSHIPEHIQEVPVQYSIMEPQLIETEMLSFETKFEESQSAESDFVKVQETKTVTDITVKEDLSQNTPIMQQDGLNDAITLIKVPELPKVNVQNDDDGFDKKDLHPGIIHSTNPSIIIPESVITLSTGSAIRIPFSISGWMLE